MGKDRTIKILGGVLGNIVLHKILVRHTNKFESLSHLKKEVEAYRDNASEWASQFNWNEEDLEKIKLEALNNLDKDMKRTYSDVKFSKEEAEQLVEETLKEILE